MKNKEEILKRIATEKEAIASLKLLLKQRKANLLSLQVFLKTK
jgi:hypothetical protein